MRPRLKISLYKYETPYKGTFEITHCCNNVTVALKLLQQNVNTIYVVLITTNMKLVMISMSESTSQSIFFFTIYFSVLENKYFFLPSTFFKSAITGCSISFRGVLEPVFADPKPRHGWFKSLTTPLSKYHRP